MTTEEYRVSRNLELLAAGYSPGRIPVMINEEIAAGRPQALDAQADRDAADAADQERIRLERAEADRKRAKVMKNEEILDLLPTTGLSPDDFQDKMRAHGITTLKKGKELLRNLVPVMEDNEFAALEEEAARTRG